jgi:FKBP-type peptidyl-prolyl cis-trans isomerase
MVLKSILLLLHVSMVAGFVELGAKTLVCNVPKVSWLDRPVSRVGLRSSEPSMTIAKYGLDFFKIQLSRKQMMFVSSVLSSIFQVQSEACAEGLGSDGENWAQHEGPFAESDFQKFNQAASGLKYLDVAEGTGERPQAGDSVRLHYSGYLADGTKFDSSYRGALFPFSLFARDAPPVAFKLDKGSLIPGFLEGVLGMRVGGRRILYIPPDLGYGPRGAAGVIPPDARLIFYIELRKVGSGIIL